MRATAHTSKTRSRNHLNNCTHTHTNAHTSIAVIEVSAWFRVACLACRDLRSKVSVAWERPTRPVADTDLSRTEVRGVRWSTKCGDANLLLTHTTQKNRSYTPTTTGELQSVQRFLSRGLCVRWGFSSRWRVVVSRDRKLIIIEFWAPVYGACCMVGVWMCVSVFVLTNACMWVPQEEVLYQKRIQRNRKTQLAALASVINQNRYVGLFRRGKGDDIIVLIFLLNIQFGNHIYFYFARLF